MFWRSKIAIEDALAIIEKAKELIAEGAEIRAPIKFMHDDESEDPLLGPEDVAFAVSGPAPPDYGDDEDDEG